ncbi:MAG: ATP-binding cassette domain-containing protein [Spirochaetota bacterium]|nr:ATP-binding cassette domain-containing protein [Spirochaetota bacterium]
MTNNNILEYSDVSFSYNNTSNALDKISFSLKKAEIIIILGSSGSGKSTLLKITNRLIELTSGCVRYNNQDIKEISPLLLRKEIAYLPQTPYLIEGSVNDNLLLSFQNKEDHNLANNKIMKTLNEVGLNEKYLTRSSHELSVGEKQRVALARTLLNHSKILLLDEPNSALDEENSNILIQTLKQIVERERISMIIVTHQLDFANNLGNRFFNLKNGKINEINNPKSAFINGVI